MSKPKRPSGLKSKGVRLWDGVVGSGRYELRADELLVLEDACREADLIDRIEKELESASLTERGSQGQPVASPLVQEIRQHRATFRQLVAQLKLPDEDNRAEESRSTAARAAANARWQRGA